MAVSKVGDASSKPSAKRKMSDDGTEERALTKYRKTSHGRSPEAKEENPLSGPHKNGRKAVSFCNNGGRIPSRGPRLKSLTPFAELSKAVFSNTVIGNTRHLNISRTYACTDMGYKFTMPQGIKKLAYRSDKGSFPLLSLSPELRNMCYDRLLTIDTGFGDKGRVLVRRHVPTLPLRITAFLTSPDVDILTTCRAVNDEATPFLYRHRFQFDSSFDLMSFLFDIGSSRRFITSLDVSCLEFTKDPHKLQKYASFSVPKQKKLATFFKCLAPLVYLLSTGMSVSSFSIGEVADDTKSDHRRQFLKPPQFGNEERWLSSGAQQFEKAAAVFKSGPVHDFLDQLTQKFRAAIEKKKGF